MRIAALCQHEGQVKRKDGQRDMVTKEEMVPTKRRDSWELWVNKLCS